MRLIPRADGLSGDPDFLKLWIGQAISDFGDQITLLALPLTAILALHASAAQMGLLAAAGTAPTALFTLFVGVWVDRLKRRPILIAADLGRAALLATIPVAFVGGWLTMTQLYVVAFLVGILSVFFIVAYQSYLPSLVDRSHLVAANGRIYSTQSAAQLAGPGIAGALVQVFTAPLPVVLDALSFLASVAGVSLIRRPEPTPVVTRRNMRADIQEGLAAILGHPMLRPYTLSAAYFAVFFSAQLAIFILYMSRDLHLDPASVGVVLATGSAGGLLGALVASRLARAIGLGPAFVLGMLAAMVGLVGRGFAGGPAPVIMSTLMSTQVLVAVGFSIWNVNGPSLRQALIPARLLGRVNASYRFLVWGSGPLGALIGGGLGELIGLRDAMLVTGAAVLLVIPILLLSPLSRIRDMPAPVVETAGSQ